MIVMLVLIFICIWCCLSNIDALLGNADKWEDDDEL
jgi:hypothetical protein